MSQDGYTLKYVNKKLSPPQIFLLERKLYFSKSSDRIVTKFSGKMVCIIIVCNLLYTSFLSKFLKSAIYFFNFLKGYKSNIFFQFGHVLTCECAIPVDF
jgi:hypothetical protein